MKNCMLLECICMTTFCVIHILLQYNHFYLKSSVSEDTSLYILLLRFLGKQDYGIESTRLPGFHWKNCKFGCGTRCLRNLSSEKMINEALICHSRWLRGCNTDKREWHREGAIWNLEFSPIEKKPTTTSTSHWRNWEHIFFWGFPFEKAIAKNWFIWKKSYRWSAERNNKWTDCEGYLLNFGTKDYMTIETENNWH